jgi:subtilisin family serine protease
VAVSCSGKRVIGLAVQRADVVVIIARVMRYIILAIYGLFTALCAGGQELDIAAPGEILLRLRAGGGKVAWEGLSPELARRYPLVEATPIFSLEPKRRAKAAAAVELEAWYRLSLASSEDPEKIAADFAALERVEFAQPNYLRRHAATGEQDSLYNLQWSLQEIGWRADVEAAEVVVAIIDSGVEYDHPDLEGQLWLNPGEVNGLDGVDDDGNGYVDDLVGWDFSDAPGLPGQGDYLERDGDPRDESGHGTHVAGIVGAASGNSRGITGMAPNARLMVLRAGFNLPSGGYLEDDDIAAAIVYAADNGAQVINMSWGDPRPAPLVRDAVRYAAASGVILVAAAGNEGEDAVFYPARFSETIAVGAVAPRGEVLAFSNWGPSIDLVAPGQSILSLFLGGGYGERSGTSMAAPHVTGMVALLLGRRPEWQSDEVRAVLRATARDVHAVGWDVFSGAGSLDFSALTIADPPLVRIKNPVQDSVVQGEKALVQLAVDDVEEWQLAWGMGRTPRDWNLLATGMAVQVEHEVSWDLSEAISGLYQLRLRALWQGRWVEDRVRVQLEQSELKVEDVRVAQVLADGHWRHVVEWSTATTVAGRLVLERAGERVHERIVSSSPSQRVVLPADLSDGDYDLLVRAEAGGRVGEWERVEGIALASPSVGHWPLEVEYELPAGYLLPTATDFNDDGAGEIVQMGYGGGQQYNAADFYQLVETSLQRVFNSLELYIPWSVQDGDGDGLEELLAVDARRVRLLEAPSPGAFPSRLAWEQRDVWGGEVADLDGDGFVEFFLRSAKGNYFQVFERAGDDDYGERAVLNIDIDGSSRGQWELGQRQVASDLDGDGRGDLLGGDSGGGLFVFEAIADNSYRQVWQQAGEGDARTVGGGADLDGDGVREFVVARYFDDAFDLSARYWQIEVYGASGRDEYALEWQTRVLGASRGGSGISYGDLNGDGILEWALVTVPDMYVFSSSFPDEYEAVWHAVVARTQRPLMSDISGDGRAELVFNTANQVQVASHRGESTAIYGPAVLKAYALDRERIQLDWQRVEGAVEYRIYRDAILLEQTPALTYIDQALIEGQNYRYYVHAVAADGREGARSAEAVAMPQSAPYILSVSRAAAHQLQVEFSAVMERVERSAHRFRISPDIGIASSAIGDRGMRRILLGFDQTLPDSGVYVLQVNGLRGASGTPLDLTSRTFSFALTPPQIAARLLEVRALSADRIQLLFDKEIRPGVDLSNAFQLDGGLLLEDINVDGNEVILTLAADAQLRPLGHAYSVRVEGLLDVDGLAVKGVSRFFYAASDLSEAKAFPNPFYSGRGEVVFGFLPPQAEVYIYDIQGQLLRVLVERDGDGGIEWAGDNSAGQALASGIYYYRIVAAGKSKVATLAIVR